MNWESRKINSNNNNNDNYEVSLNIAGAKHRHLDPERDTIEKVASTETTNVEPEIEKIVRLEQYAGPTHKHRDKEEDNQSDEDNETDNKKKNETFDESDGPIKSHSHFVQIEEEESNVEEIEIEESTTKKSSTYAAKKTVAQGMMDIALITANANQLRYLLEFNRSSPTFFFIVTLIVISLGLQVGVGVALIFKGRLDIKGKSKDVEAKRINNYVVVGIFLVTIINVFVASFTITGGSTGIPQ